jgi:hypothetical protein
MRAQPQPQIVPVTEIADALQNSQSQVSVRGKVIFHGPVEAILTKGKMLKKQEASITDDSASVRLVLWENDISKMSTNSSYKLQKVIVRLYNDTKYLTLNKQSVICQIDQLSKR